MAAKANLIMTNDIQVTAREIDFVTRFERNWEHLREILGIMRPIKKTPGAVLKSKYAEGTLQDGNVKEGEEIPYSKFTVKENRHCNIYKFRQRIHLLRNAPAESIGRKGMECGICRRRRCTENE